VDLFITLLALPKAAFVDPNDGRPGVNPDTLTVADKLLQLGNHSVQESLKTGQFSLRRHGTASLPTTMPE
jgi:hypothetical protein